MPRFRAPRAFGRRHARVAALLAAGAFGMACSFVPPPKPAHEKALSWAAGAVAGGLSLSAHAQDLALSSGADLSPETFRPVCPASDGLYGLGKAAADGLLGAEGAEYRPLAIEALLRVRLEICVLESFVYEAIVPFVQRKGIGWILPLHETIDTVIAGTVFAVALNFILFGTTKILSVLGIYHDILVGAPLRLVGYWILPEKKPKETPLIQINWPGMPAAEEEEEEETEPPPPPSAPVAIFGGICKGYGVFAGILKDFLEGVDTFAGRYLAFFSILYIAFKWAHFRLFNDFPPF
ncbi:unnamed protein product [Effrenium voratum]|nr:unnamed protein product [Effrenium voratum]